MAILPEVETEKLRLACESWCDITVLARRDESHTLNSSQGNHGLQYLRFGACLNGQLLTRASLQPC